MHLYLKRWVWGCEDNINWNNKDKGMGLWLYVNVIPRLIFFGSWMLKVGSLFKTLAESYECVCIYVKSKAVEWYKAVITSATLPNYKGLVAVTGLEIYRVQKIPMTTLQHRLTI